VLAVLFFHPIAGRWRPACLRVATASVETVSPPLEYSELYHLNVEAFRTPVVGVRQTEPNPVSAYLATPFCCRC